MFLKIVMLPNAPQVSYVFHPTELARR